MYQIQALPAAALEYVYPPVDAELAKVPYGPGDLLYDALAPFVPVWSVLFSSTVYASMSSMWQSL